MKMPMLNGEKQQFALPNGIYLHCDTTTRTIRTYGHPRRWYPLLIAYAELTTLTSSTSPNGYC